MNKNLIRGLAIGIPLIILGVVLYVLFFMGPQPQIGPSPITAPGPTATGPAGEKPPAAPPATPEISPPKQPEAPAVTPTAPPQKVTPAPESRAPAPKVTVFPPEKEKERYGFLVNRYRNFGSAGRMQEELKKREIPGFIQQDPNKPGLFELWAGPFSDPGTARAAEKSLRDLLKGPRKIHKIQATVPK